MRGELHLMSDETLIDMGLATPEMIAADIERRAARERRWRALPWRVRFWWGVVRPRTTEARRRLGHAARALRGIDCETEDQAAGFSRE